MIVTMIGIDICGIRNSPLIVFKLPNCNWNFKQVEVEFTDMNVTMIPPNQSVPDFINHQLHLVIHK